MIYQMKLVVGKDDSKIVIDTVPQVMATASPVFRSMLQPDRFLEGQKLLENKPFTVTLPEDDPAAMKILCDILHFQTNRVPMEEITLMLVTSIATLIDKYDCAAAIQPWPKLWLTELLSLHTPWNVENMKVQDIIMWTRVSYHLGYEDEFRECTTSLIRRLPESDIHGEQQILEYEQLSATVRGAIQSARAKCVFLFWAVCHDTIKDIRKGGQCKNYKPSGWTSEDHDQTKLNCSALLLGSAIFAAQEVCDGQDSEKLENWQKSPSYYYPGMVRFAERLNCVRQVEYVQNSWIRRGVGHKNCGLPEQTKRQVETIYEGTKVGLRLLDIGSHAESHPEPRKQLSLAERHQSRSQLPDSSKFARREVIPKFWPSILDP